MHKYICRQWKNRKITVLFIIIGFMVGSLVISLGISACRESFAYADDQMRGNPERQLDIFLSNNGMWKQKDVEELIEVLGSYGEVQLMSMDSRQLESFGESSPVVPVLFHRKPHWHVPLLEGRYFSGDGMEHSEKVIVLGKQLAEKYQVDLEDMVDIGGAGFRVIGICGRPARETSWEYAVYMPWADYLELYPGCFEDWEKGTALTVHLEDGKKELLEQIEQYIDGAAEKGIQMNYRLVDDVDTSAIRNTLILTTVSTILVFSTAVINIIHLMLAGILLLLSLLGCIGAILAETTVRYHEFGICYAVGMTKKNMIVLMQGEILMLYCSSFLIASGSCILFWGVLLKSTAVSVNWRTILAASAVMLVCVVLCAGMPFLKLRKMESVDMIKGGSDDLYRTQKY